MAETEVVRSWNDFWGELFCLRLPAGQPERWTVREERAKRLAEAGPLPPQARVLDLGCGDGLLDICLARRGAQVTAVDRIEPVLEAARREPGGDAVRFEAADLRALDYPAGSFDAVLMLELMGLMSRADDALLLARARRWLTDAGRLFVDLSDEPAETGGRWTRACDGGTLAVSWRYDPATRRQQIEPEFTTDGGETIVLGDPYDSARPESRGVLRYLYRREELEALLQPAFRVRALAGDWRPGKFLLIGEAA